MISYCVNCVLPSTKPDLAFDARGMCQACLNFQNRTEVNWDQRRQELVDVLQSERERKTTAWDCIVPVSGGKDSTFQILTLKKLGFNPLAVTARTCDLTDLGRRNLENLRSLGVDHVDFSPNPAVRSTLNRIGLTEVGDISWAEHVAIFTMPVIASVAFKVPLIVWGENSQNEYGGPPRMADNRVLDRAWLEEFGGLLGLRVTDLAAAYGVSDTDLFLYRYPESADLESVGTRGLFLGYFVPWDGLTNVILSQAHGFESWPVPTHGSIAGYENLDNHQAGIHEYFKFLKFGFGRASDIVSMHIRRNRLAREDGIQLVRKLEGKFPTEYMGKPLAEILKPLGVTVDAFREICDDYTNRALFELDSQGNLLRDPSGELVKVAYDNG